MTDGPKIKRGTAQRLGLRQRPRMLIQLPDISEEELQDFMARFAEHARYSTVVLPADDPQFSLNRPPARWRMRRRP